MPLRITAPFAACCPCLSGHRLAAAPAAATNDNRAASLADPVVQAALRHFAANGLNAARDAAKRAECALLSGEGEASRRWLEICGLLGGRPHREDPRNPAAAG